MIIGYSRTFGAAGGPPTTNLQFWYAADQTSGYSDNDDLTSSPGVPQLAIGGSFATYKMVPGTNGPGKYRTGISGFNGYPVFEFRQSSSDWIKVILNPDLSAWTEGSGFIVLKNKADPPGASDVMWKMG